MCLKKEKNTTPRVVYIVMHRTWYQVCTSAGMCQPGNTRTIPVTGTTPYTGTTGYICAK